jgi:hypothetical protein
MRGKMTTKKTIAPKTRKRAVADGRREYRLDYSKARANRFAGQNQGERLVVILDPDIAEVFTTPESVNTVLRALIATMPPSAK